MISGVDNQRVLVLTCMNEEEATAVKNFLNVIRVNEMSKYELVTEGGTKYFLESINNELWDMKFTNKVQYTSGEVVTMRAVLDEKYLISCFSKDEYDSVKNFLQTIRG